MTMKTIWNIRSFLRHELWIFTSRIELGKRSPFSKQEIEAELIRRDEIDDLPRDLKHA